MRKLYIRIHPDLFQQYPDKASVNEENFQKLMGFFNTIKEGENPTAQKFQLKFYMTTPKEGVFEETSLSMRTSGGQCQHQAAKYLGEFFASVGLPDKFSWGTDYWQEKFVQEDQKWADEEMEAHREEVRKKDKSFKFEVPRSTAWTEREAA